MEDKNYIKKLYEALEEDLDIEMCNDKKYIEKRLLRNEIENKMIINEPELFEKLEDIIIQMESIEQEISFEQGFRTANKMLFDSMR